MPSSATITEFHSFTAQSLIRASHHNTNFGVFRGHIIPVHPSTATAGTSGSYDLGSTEYRWGTIYCNTIDANTSTAFDDLSPMTTKGDLITRTTTGNVRLAIGTNGQVLTADSSLTSGMKWANASGGGGGGSLRWIEAASAPVLTQENDIEVYEFVPALAQEIFCTIRVPNTYIAGSPISLRILWYCASTANDALINAIATLIRSESDEITSTTNQRTTTNSAITLSSSNDQEPQKVTLDITDSSGQINSVAVSAGDLIKVKVKEDSSTVADNIKLIFDASEVTFS